MWLLLVCCVISAAGAEIPPLNRHVDDLWGFERGGDSCVIHPDCKPDKNTKCLAKDCAFQRWILGPDIIDDSNPFTIHYIGPSDERGASDSYSFKVDLTLPEASLIESKNFTYYYLQLPILKAYPNIGNLNVSAKLWVDQLPEGGYIGLCTNTNFRPGYEGSGTGCLRTQDGGSRQWLDYKLDLTKSANETEERVLGSNTKFLYADIKGSDVVSKTDMFGLIIRANKGGRFTFYIDDIHFVGDVPKTALFNSYAYQLKSKYIRRIRQYMTEGLADLNAKMASVNTSDISKAGHNEEIGQFISSLRKKLASHEAIFTVDEYKKMAFYRDGLKFAATASNYLVHNPGKRTVIMPSDITGGEKEFLGVVAQGETESLSFVLRSLQDQVVSIQSGSFSHAVTGEILPQNSIDIRVVKAWYQSNDTSVNMVPGKKALVSELLLKNDALVKVEMGDTFETKRNWLEIDIPDIGKTYHDISSYNSLMPLNANLRDSDELLPFVMDANTNKEIWININITKKQRPGRYHGAINLVYENGGRDSFPLEVIVLPITLAPSPVDYGIYYHGFVMVDNGLVAKEGLTHGWKTAEQYRVEMENIRDHGVLYPNLQYVGGNDFDHITQALKLREQSNLPCDKIFTSGGNMAPLLSKNYEDVADIDSLKLDHLIFDKDKKIYDKKKIEWMLEKLKRWKKAIAKAKISCAKPEIYIYGVDEKGDDRGKALGYKEMLKRARIPLKFLREKGVKTYAAVFEGAADIIAPYVDLVNFNGIPTELEEKKWRSYGREVYTYGNPQAGIESFSLYRKNFGFLLLRSGFDGEMDYAYQRRMSDYISVQNKPENLVKINPKAVTASQCGASICYKTTGDEYNLITGRQYKLYISLDGKGYLDYPSIWNDFDSSLKGKRFRDHVFAYPTSNGVIDTIQWEGFREGVDDVRYFQTLKKLIEQMPETEKARNAQAYLDSILSLQTPIDDVNRIRLNIIDHILRLRSKFDEKIDTDSDGLFDVNEFMIGTAPLRNDTDNDGMEDGWEIKYNLNPLSNEDANKDIDNDGLNNLQEFRMNTDPLTANADKTAKEKG